jgi:hypothetical protein
MNCPFVQSVAYVGDLRIVTRNIEAANGYIHEIDGVSNDIRHTYIHMYIKT